MFIILAFIALIHAKCGLWYEFNRDQSGEGPFTSQKCYEIESCYSKVAWTWSWSFESMDKQEICNDIEMLEQCKRAQHIFDLFNLDNNLPIFNLDCSSHVICAAPPNLFPYRTNSRTSYWCQNIDSYNLCLSAKLIVQNANADKKFPINCVVADMLADGIRIINYTTPGVYVPTEYVYTNSTIISTTKPALAIRLVPTIIGVLFMLFL